MQQNGSGESKIAGIRDHAGDIIELDVRSVDEALPPVLDETDAYLPDRIEADLVLDFLKHPDLSEDLAERCRDQGVPVVASGKKMRVEGTHTPPT
jgi:hypothetical protein